MKRPVAISLSPNTEKDDIILALKTLFAPIQMYNFRNTEKFEDKFAKYFGNNYKALAVNSGRGALYLILKVLGVSSGEEVALQALTCVAVPNSILWLGGTPLFIDVDESLNLDPSDLGKKINEKTKAIIVQHAFGVPADMEKILKVAKKYKVPVIEDCALSLGGTFNNKLLGTIGDISFFSFGRDKVISSVFGGMIVCKDKNLYDALLSEREKLSYPSPQWVMQQILHPILFSIILPLYQIGIGKVTIGKLMLFFLQTLRILSKPVYEIEKSGGRPKYFPAKMPGALSILAMNQFNKLQRFNAHRKKISDIYFKKLKAGNYKLPSKKEGAIWVRFPVVIKNANKVIRYAKNNKIVLGDWYKKVVVPVNNLSRIGYKTGSCPVAEKLAGQILNFPTYPTFSEDDAYNLVQFINKISRQI